MRGRLSKGILVATLSKYIVRCPLAGVMQLRSKKALAIRASSGAIVRSIWIPTLSNHSKQ